jgi:hypothetical protein
MKHLNLSTVGLLSCVAFTSAAQADTPSTLGAALTGGQATVNGRAFYFNRNFDKPGVSDSRALVVGGIAKYETANYANTKLGLAYYGSHSLSFLVDRDDSKGSSLLQSDADDIALLGEAYLDFNVTGHQFKAGRQRLSTPLMNDHDLRMLPSSYEAVVYRNRQLTNSLVEIGHVTRYTGFASSLSKFDKQTADWGQDGLAYLYGETKLGTVALRAQYITPLEGSGVYEDFRYLDATAPLPFGEKTHVAAQLGATNYQLGDTSVMFGLRAGTTVGRFDLSTLYNQINDRAFKTVRSGIMYTDLQQGYGNYDPSWAWGAQASYRVNDDTSVRLAFVNISSDDIKLYKVDDFSETNLDINHKINKSTALRVRYSIKDQDKNSTREDRDDFRIILSVKL